MRTAAASASSRSAGSWTCRRPPTTSAPPASGPPGRSMMSGCSAGSASCMPRTTSPTDPDECGKRCGWRARTSAAATSSACCGAMRRGKPWKTTRPDLTARRRPDLVNRDFSASAPNQLWVADFTYGRCWEGVVFFAFVIDVYSRRIVGWQFASHMRTTLVLDALRMALSQRGPGADVELVHHSDRGSQYTSIDYTQTLADHGVLASVGSVGDAYDNAMAESFVDSFKTELIADRVWQTR